MSIWQRVGRYEVMCDSDRYRIFPKLPDGTAIVVWIANQTINLKAFDKVTTFKHYRHRGSWLWSDSRQKQGGCGEQHVVAEIARMLFGGNKGRAKQLIAATVSL